MFSGLTYLLSSNRLHVLKVTPSFSMNTQMIPLVHLFESLRHNLVIKASSCTSHHAKILSHACKFQTTYPWACDYMNNHVFQTSPTLYQLLYHNKGVDKASARRLHMLYVTIPPIDNKSSLLTYEKIHYKLCLLYYVMHPIICLPQPH